MALPAKVSFGFGLEPHRFVCIGMHFVGFPDIKIKKIHKACYDDYQADKKAMHQLVLSSTAFVTKNDVLRAMKAGKMFEMEQKLTEMEAGNKRRQKQLMAVGLGLGAAALGSVVVIAKTQRSPYQQQSSPP